MCPAFFVKDYSPIPGAITFLIRTEIILSYQKFHRSRVDISTYFKCYDSLYEWLLSLGAKQKSVRNKMKIWLSEVRNWLNRE